MYSCIGTIVGIGLEEEHKEEGEIISG